MCDVLRKCKNYFASEINNKGQLIGIGEFGVYGDRNVDATFYCFSSPLNRDRWIAEGTHRLSIGIYEMRKWRAAMRPADFNKMLDNLICCMDVVDDVIVTDGEVTCGSVFFGRVGVESFNFRKIVNIVTVDAEDDIYDVGDVNDDIHRGAIGDDEVDEDVEYGDSGGSLPGDEQYW